MHCGNHTNSQADEMDTSFAIRPLGYNSDVSNIIGPLPARPQSLKAIRPDNDTLQRGGAHNKQASCTREVVHVHHSGNPTDWWPDSQR